MDGHCRDPEIGGGAGDPDGDFAPVGDEKALQPRTRSARDRTCIDGIIGALPPRP